MDHQDSSGCRGCPNGDDVLTLSSGQAHDAPEGRRLLHRLGGRQGNLHLLMDQAYEGNGARQPALDLGFKLVVPPFKTRIHPWEYDQEMYKRSNEVERLFQRLKGFRHIFSWFKKLDIMFLGFIVFVLIFNALLWYKHALPQSDRYAGVSAGSCWRPCCRRRRAGRRRTCRCADGWPRTNLAEVGELFRGVFPGIPHQIVQQMVHERPTRGVRGALCERDPLLLPDAGLRTGRGGKR